jgi:hypothetical protein
MVIEDDVVMTDDELIGKPADVIGNMVGTKMKTKTSATKAHEFTKLLSYCLSV